MAHTRRIAALGLSTLVFVACQPDYGVGTLCGTPSQGFDIEEASVLQDAQGYWGMRDAVILEYDDSGLQEGAAWRVRSVEIMPMLPSDQFELFQDGQTVSVEVWDADNPAGNPYRATQTFKKDELDWEETLLTAPAEAVAGTHRKAWWRFGFEDIIPMEGMTNTNYLVGVYWTTGEPPMGYSNFNRSCALNWTDYADGRGFVLNSASGSGNQCSWPMLRVNLEIIEEVEECNGESYEF